MGEVFEIVYDTLVIREDLAQLDRPTLRRIKSAIEVKLVTRPDVYGKPLRGALRGYWSLRVGDYRIAYHLKGSTVYIDVVEHRTKAYKILSTRATP